MSPAKLRSLVVLLAPLPLVVGYILAAWVGLDAFWVALGIIVFFVVALAVLRPFAQRRKDG